MSHYKPYPTYKDSGVEWLGHVPEHWEIAPLWSVYRPIKRTGFTNEPLLSVYRDYGVVLKASRDDNHNRASDDLGPYQLVEPGNLVTNKMKTWQGSIAVSELRGIVSPAYFIYEPIRDVFARFIHHLMRCQLYITGYLSISKGIRVGQWDLDPDHFRTFPLLFPPKEEQERIVNLLDRETARIDALIAKKTEFIELLAKKRQALITHAVTKGLDPNVKMKDSGVEWIGEVPEHWAVTAIKRALSIPITDGPHETPVFYDAGVPFASAESVSSGTIDFQKIRGFISREDHSRFSKKYLPKKGDIFMVKSGATTGVTALVEDDREFNIWSPLAAIRCNRKKALPEFVLSYMRSTKFLDGVALNWSYGTQQNIGMGVLENMALPLPPLYEQEAIAVYIAGHQARIDLLIEKTQLSIDLLKKRRSALITAAVTGQIDLREST
jgi:type I restriction enzyme S subunit